MLSNLYLLPCVGGSFARPASHGTMAGLAQAAQAPVFLPLSISSSLVQPGARSAVKSAAAQLGTALQVWAWQEGCECRCRHG